MFKLHRSLAILTVFVGFSTVLAYQARDTKQETLPPAERLLWVDPGDPSTRDFVYGVGGPENQPQPPFRFVKEDLSGTRAKVNVVDARGVNWNVKWGHEAHSSTFCTRLLWALGYFVETEYFVPRGRIEGVHDLKRAKSRVDRNGDFEEARFQLRSDSPKFLAGQSWTWPDNPFVGTPQLQGLKVLMLLVSNWDTKDSRNSVKQGGQRVMDSNLGIFEDESTGQRRHLYSNFDWGASLGEWGGTLTWNRWNYKGFESQTPNFVKGFEDGRVQWGFKGKHRDDITNGISAADVQWILKYLSRITDKQIQEGLIASGASQDETASFTRTIRNRIKQLEQVVAEDRRSTTMIR
jgi:hypothetical protein